MKRSVSVVGLVVLLSGGVAFGQRGEVVSYYQPASNGPIIIPVVASGGFVMTDIVLQGGAATAIWIQEDAVTKLNVTIGTPDKLSYHFESGVVFSAGTQVSIGPDPRNVTISGYIPCPDPCLAGTGLPAVGEWGTFIMVMCLLIGGTGVFARRKAPAA